MNTEAEAVRAYTTLNELRYHFPSTEEWEKLLLHLGKTQADDEPLPFATIFDCNGFDIAFWCLRGEDDVYRRQIRLYAVWCARQVEHLMADPRSLAALDVAERRANGLATDQELAAARSAAKAAAKTAKKTAEMCSARNAMKNAAISAARWAASLAADVAGDEPMDAVAKARDIKESAARSVKYAARAAQEKEFRRVFCGGKR